MNKKEFLEMTQEVINGVHPELTALIVNALSEKIDKADKTEIEVPTINADSSENTEEDSIDDDIKLYMEKYELTQDEVEEVQSTFDDFNGSVSMWDVEDLKPNQKKLLVDLLFDSDNLYVDDNEIINYETLHDRTCDSPEDYIDIDDAINNRWEAADKEELLEVLE